MDENGDGDGNHNESSSDENSFQIVNIEVNRESDEAGEVGNGEREQQFDISLAAAHSYMGPNLVAVSGRRVVEAGWRGRVPVGAHPGAVFPGETVPLLLPRADPHALLLRDHRLFGLLCPDETSSCVSGYGVLCEVLECGGDLPEEGEEEDDDLDEISGHLRSWRDPPARFKARANHRFRFLKMPKRATPIRTFARFRPVEVEVLPELSPRPPLRHARLASLDHLRPLCPQLRRVEAAVCGWPAALLHAFDVGRIRDTLQNYFRTLRLDDKLPEEPVSLSFWVASNLPLGARDRLALLVADSALLRLHMELRFISQKSILCCSTCMSEIAREESIFAMSSEGVHSNYINLGGFMHDIVTVSTASNVALQGSPSTEFSWFPGYSWTVALCSSCGSHVGWRFDACGRLRPANFYGVCRNTVQPRHPAP